MSEHQWSSGVRIHPGRLGGWREHASARARHAALRRVARQSGWGEVVRRLTFLANVHNRSNNRELGEVADRDKRWAERQEHHAP